MKTQIKQLGNVTVVELDGKLDYESQEPLKVELHRLLAVPAPSTQTDYFGKKIVFNLEGLEFVGSSGITNFIQTLTEFNSRSQVKPVYTHVKSEFKRIIKVMDGAQSFDFLEIDENVTRKLIEN